MQGTHKCQGQVRPRVSDQSSHWEERTQALEPEGSRKSRWIRQTGCLEAGRLAAETREEVGWLLGQDIPGRWQPEKWEGNSSPGQRLRGGLAPGRARLGRGQEAGEGCSQSRRGPSGRQGRQGPWEGSRQRCQRPRQVQHGSLTLCP